MQTLQASTAVLAEAQQAESIGTNILTLIHKGHSVADIFSVTAEFLADSEAPTLSEANEYLLNWARNGSWAITL